MKSSKRPASLLAAALGLWLEGSAVAQDIPPDPPPAALQDLVINGPYYKQLVQMKDLVADILPPPAYIIESYLTTLQVIDALETAQADGLVDEEEQRGIEVFVNYGLLLKDGAPGLFPGYFERIALWTGALSEATPEDLTLKQALVVDSMLPATAFFGIRDTVFVPLIRAGDLAGAKALARGELQSAYDAHRIAIDVVVASSRTVSARIEQEVAETLAGAGEGAALDDALIGSPLYLKVIQMKDVVADILPPPAYIIESYLTVLQLIDLAESAQADGSISVEEQTALDALIEWGRQLKEGNSALGELAGYLERQAFWSIDLGDATSEEQSIRQLMLVASAEPALEFYDIRDNELVPLISSGDVEGAKVVARTALLTSYAAHRTNIDALVIQSNQRFISLEAQVAALLAP